MVTSDGTMLGNIEFPFAVELEIIPKVHETSSMNFNASTIRYFEI